MATLRIGLGKEIIDRLPNTHTWVIERTNRVVLYDVQWQAELLTLQHIRGNYADLHAQAFVQNYGNGYKIALIGWL